MSRNSIFFLLSVSLGIPTLPKPSNRAEIPFQFSHAFGFVLICGEVDGKSAVLMLDTGSNRTIISSRLVKAYSFSPENTASTVTVSTGRATTMYATTSVKVGPISWNDHRVLVMEMTDFSKNLGQNVDGLLGMDFLSEFESAVVDLKHHKLILR